MNVPRKLTTAVFFGFLLFAGELVSAAATVIFFEDFEEATPGGTYTPPSTYGTRVSPTVGSWGVVPNDHAAIVEGTPIGTGQALAAYDRVAGLALRVLARVDPQVSGPVVSGKLQISYDFVATGSMANQGPMQVQVQTETSQPFIQILVSSLAESGGIETKIAFSNSTTGIDMDAKTETCLPNGTAIRIFMEVNIDTAKYDVKLTRLSDAVVLGKFTDLDFVTTTDLKTVGIGKIDMQFGFPDFSDPNGEGNASVIVDNLQVAIGE